MIVIPARLRPGHTSDPGANKPQSERTSSSMALAVIRAFEMIYGLIPLPARISNRGHRRG